MIEDIPGLSCLLSKHFPPKHAYLDESPEELRANQEMSEAEYQRYETWQRVCNKMKMNAACRQCPNVDIADEPGDLAEPRGLPANYRRGTKT